MADMNHQTPALLPTIAGPQDIKKFGVSELEQIADEIRQFLVHSVAQTGGHVASNLGVVELTLALHKVFSSPQDAIIWDVGHQSYVHKLLTGRMEKMDTLRKLDGLSGFPKRSESDHDLFETGHSSTSISAALGIARAKQLSGDDGHAIAIIGDGALTGGMAMEALNDAGMCKANLLVILNDNGMSIAPNVGAMSRTLNRLRIRPGYSRTRNFMQRLLHRMSEQSRLRRIIHRTRRSIKSLTVPSMFFEDFGFRYFGPVDGHDLHYLTDMLAHVKALRGPVLLHVHTQKGRGYAFAEKNPDAFHGVSPFHVESGRPLRCVNGTWSECFGTAMMSLGERYPGVLAVSAAMPDGTGLSAFRDRWPERFFDVGIAEQHAVTMAAGLCAGGARPVVAVYSTFLQRAYDQLLHDVCLQKLPVVFAVDRAGVVGDDGETHQGVYDLSFLTAMPNMTVLAPSSNVELEAMLAFALSQREGPVAIRYPRGCCEMASYPFLPLKRGKGVVVRAGSDVTLVAAGALLVYAVEAAELLKKEGLSARVVDPRFIKPLDQALLTVCAVETGCLHVFEDNVVTGGFGQQVLAAIHDDVPDAQVHLHGWPDSPIPHGPRDFWLTQYGLDAKGMAASVLQSEQLKDPVNSMRRSVASGKTKT